MAKFFITLLVLGVCYASYSLAFPAEATKATALASAITQHDEVVDDADLKGSETFGFGYYPGFGGGFGGGYGGYGGYGGGFGRYGYGSRWGYGGYGGYGGFGYRRPIYPVWG